MATNEIVVGVDGSEGSIEALDWALKHAAHTGADVVVMHSWTYPAIMDPFALTVMPDHETMTAGAAEWVDHALEKVTVPPNVAVHVEIVEGAAADQLVKRAEASSLLVVGARGHGGFLGLLLGSVATQCVNRSTVPVVVVPVGVDAP